MINPNIYLIDKNYIYTSSTIFNNVDYVKMVRPLIYDSQKFIRNIVGSGLYDELQEQCSTSAFTEDNQYLIDFYVRPCLLNQILSKIVFKLHYKLSPTGVQKQATDNSIPATLTEIDRNIDEYRTSAESIGNELRDYLIAYPDKYPLYANPGTSLDTIYPAKQTYFCGMYLGNADSTNYNINKNNCN